MKYISLSIITGLFLFCLSGCGKQSAQAQRIKPLTAKTSDFSQTKDNSTVSVKKMTPQDSRDTFSGINLLAQDVQPLQVSISNLNQDPINITQDNIGLTLIDAEQCQQ
jgi:curli biogenesis system outer membrane secretion channel CsgG